MRLVEITKDGKRTTYDMDAAMSVRELKVSPGAASLTEIVFPFPLGRVVVDASYDSLMKGAKA